MAELVLLGGVVGLLNAERLLDVGCDLLDGGEDVLHV